MGEMGVHESQRLCSFWVMGISTPCQDRDALKSTTSTACVVQYIQILFCRPICFQISLDSFIPVDTYILHSNISHIM